jgi:hypothetical protein
MKDDLKEQISQFFFHVFIIVLLYCFEKLIEFIQKAAENAAVGLLPVPGASLGTP